MNSAKTPFHYEEEVDDTPWLVYPQEEGFEGVNRLGTAELLLDISHVVIDYYTFLNVVNRNLSSVPMIS